MTRDFFFLILGVFLISNLLTGCNKEIHLDAHLLPLGCRLVHGKGIDPREASAESGCV